MSAIDMKLEPQSLKVGERYYFIRRNIEKHTLNGKEISPYDCPRLYSMGYFVGLLDNGEPIFSKYKMPEPNDSELIADIENAMKKPVVRVYDLKGFLKLMEEWVWEGNHKKNLCVEVDMKF